jgi:hypothetical protein
MAFPPGEIGASQITEAGLRSRCRLRQALVGRQISLKHRNVARASFHRPALTGLLDFTPSARQQAEHFMLISSVYILTIY